jgi:Thrombospondin type 3 repeat
MSQVGAVSAFEPQCFRNVSVVDTASGVIAFSVKNVDDDLFFVQWDRLLPSRLDITEKNPPLQYTSPDIANIILLSDVDPYTAITVDPYELGKRDLNYIFDLGKVYPADTIMTMLDYYALGKVTVAISQDGISYIPVEISRIDAFAFRYLRVTFVKQTTQSDITLFHTLNFYPRIASRYLVASPGGEIRVYSSYACQTGKYREYLSERSDIPYGFAVPMITTPLVIATNPLYKNDTDNDTIENIRDNCPMLANPDQRDRNRDGIGDACSDDDSDGVSGLADNCATVSNPDQKDLNVNQIWDACEFDSDSDGIVDALDNAIRIVNPDQADLDRDNIGDIMDNCSLYNPDQLDLDKNWKWDVCDRDIEYRKTNDTDKDGILDFVDNCSKISNPDQKDTDRDSVGDVCDNCASIQNTNQTDDDKNGIGNMCDDTDWDDVEGWRDNCPTISNSDQADNNNNTIGNACEDTDWDRLLESSDNCPALYNPDQQDTDGDTIGNACDTKDDRILESNKTIFMMLFATIALVFIGGIIFFLRRFKL